MQSLVSRSSYAGIGESRKTLRGKVGIASWHGRWTWSAAAAWSSLEQVKPPLQAVACRSSSPRTWMHAAMQLSFEWEFQPGSCEPQRNEKLVYDALQRTCRMCRQRSSGAQPTVNASECRGCSG